MGKPTISNSMSSEEKRDLIIVDNKYTKFYYKANNTMFLFSDCNNQIFEHFTDISSIICTDWSNLREFHKLSKNNSYTKRLRKKKLIKINLHIDKK